MHLHLFAFKCLNSLKIYTKVYLVKTWQLFQYFSSELFKTSSLQHCLKINIPANEKWTNLNVDWTIVKANTSKKYGRSSDLGKNRM